MNEIMIRGINIVNNAINYTYCFTYIYVHSQTCIKRSSLGQRKSGLIRQVTPSKRSIYMKFYMTRKEKGDLLIQVTA